MPESTGHDCYTGRWWQEGAIHRVSLSTCWNARIFSAASSFLESSFVSTGCGLCLHWRCFLLVASDACLQAAFKLGLQWQRRVFDANMLPKRLTHVISLPRASYPRSNYSSAGACWWHAKLPLRMPKSNNTLASIHPFWGVSIRYIYFCRHSSIQTHLDLHHCVMHVCGPLESKEL